MDDYLVIGALANTGRLHFPIQGKNPAVFY
jgi:hypothetical protein